VKKWIVILSGLLTVQLGLAIVVNLAGKDYGAFEPQQKLLAYDEQTVDGLRIEDGKGSVVLNQRDGQWLLSESGDFPADQQAVQRLLDKLGVLEKGWPVATTAGASKRFKVADDAFERKLTLLSGDEPSATLYVGTSPGFRKVHVRPEGNDEVYAVAFNTWEADAGADAWIDKDVLKLDAKQVERLEMSGFVLQREGETLQLADLADGEVLNKEDASALFDQLAGLRIQSLLGTVEKPEYRQDEPEFEVKLVRNGGDALTYRFSKPQDESHYVVKRSDFDHFFKVGENVVKPIKESTREKLVQANEDSVAGDQTVADAFAGGNAEDAEMKE